MWSAYFLCCNIWYCSYPKHISNSLHSCLCWTMRLPTINISAICLEIYLYKLIYLSVKLIFFCLLLFSFAGTHDRFQNPCSCLPRSRCTQAQTLSFCSPNSNISKRFYAFLYIPVFIPPPPSISTPRLSRPTFIPYISKISHFFLLDFCN